METHELEYVYPGTLQDLNKHIAQLYPLGLQWLGYEVTFLSNDGRPDLTLIHPVTIAIEINGERPVLKLSCPDLNWHITEPKWLKLIGELDRRGGKVAEPEPVAQKPKRGGRRHRYTKQERFAACKEYRALGGGQSQDQFMDERYGGMSGRTLRDWLMESGL